MKKAGMLLNQRFCPFYWQIPYWPQFGSDASVAFLHKIMHIPIVVNPHSFSYFSPHQPNP